jgi:hypothetical protein
MPQILPPLLRPAARQPQQTTPQAGPRYHIYFRIGSRQQPIALKLEFSRKRLPLGYEPDFADEALERRQSRRQH